MAESLDFSGTGTAYCYVRRTGFRVSLPQVILWQGKTFSSYTIMILLSHGKNCETRPDFTYSMINHTLSQPNRLMSRNLWCKVVSSGHQKTRMKIVFLLLLKYLIQLMTFIASWCQIGQHCTTYFAGGH